MNLFFVGTAAELVKMAPVIRETKRRGLPFHVVASGQNALVGSELWHLADVAGPDEVLFDDAIPPRAVYLAAFLARTMATGLVDLRRVIRGAGGAAQVKGIVHGDTVSTLLGAMLFSALGVPVHHVEAGLRSFRLREPFPEEICRVAVSRLAKVAYCPNEWAASHLTRAGLRKVVTGGNTLYDALELALSAGEEDPAVLRRGGALASGSGDPFFVLVVHRQENLVGGRFLREVLAKVRARLDRGGLRCCFVMHALTKAALEREGLYDDVARDPRFVLLPRQPYVGFTRILAKATCLVTDGGSNQEEAFYLGMPCLLMRRVTERIEGLGENVLLAPEPLGEIDGFLADPSRWKRPRVHLDVSPSAVVVEDLAQNVSGFRQA